MSFSTCWPRSHLNSSLLRKRTWDGANAWHSYTLEKEWQLWVNKSTLDLSVMALHYCQALIGVRTPHKFKRIDTRDTTHAAISLFFRFWWIRGFGGNSRSKTVQKGKSCKGIKTFFWFSNDGENLRQLWHDAMDVVRRLQALSLLAMPDSPYIRHWRPNKQQQAPRHSQVQ